MAGIQCGYARVSTTDQDTGLQVEALKNAGCEKIWEEKASGTNRNRSALEECLNYLREGDVLVVTRIDRLARSLRDLQNIVHDLEKKGINLKATEQPIDTSNAAGKAFLDMLGVFAEFETNLRKERQLEGIAKAKSKGVYKGRAPLSDTTKAEVLKLFSEGVKKTEIVKLTGVGRTSVHNILKEA
jgi:DNA invertase Pin-like site-specific DNA recombinase